MKTLLHLLRQILPGCLLLLTFSGCIKEPGPNIPPVYKPEWLLTKFIEVTAYGDPILGPIYGEFYYDKRETVYEYNQYYKPYRRLLFYPVAHGDTLNLRLLMRDTLYYDRSLRVSRVESLDNTNKVTSTKQFTYSGNDTLPGSLEINYYDSNGAPRPGFSARYEYWGDTMVLAIYPYGKGYDTLKYVYEQGNYTRDCSGEGTSSCTERYSGHTGRNVGWSLNLSHGLALDIPDTDQSPLISQGNWQHKEDPGQYRSLTFNEEGLLVRAGWTNYIPEYSTNCRFEYKKAE